MSVFLFKAKYNFSPDDIDIRDFHKLENTQCWRARSMIEGRLLRKAEEFDKARQVRQREIDRLEGIARVEQRLEDCRRMAREEKEKEREEKEKEREEKERMRICSAGVCKGMSWEDAKEFIIRKHDEKYWKQWIHCVSWEDAPLSVALVLVPLEVETNNNNKPSRRTRKRRDAFKRCLTDAPVREILAALIAGANFCLLGLGLCWMINR